MSSFKNIFKKQFKKDMKKRVKKFQAPFIIKEITVDDIFTNAAIIYCPNLSHLHIEDDCKENSTEQLDFKVL